MHTQSIQCYVVVLISVSMVLSCQRACTQYDGRQTIPLPQRAVIFYTGTKLYCLWQAHGCEQHGGWSFNSHYHWVI